MPEPHPAVQWAGSQNFNDEGGNLFGQPVHTLIHQALQQAVSPLSKSIHQLRVEAEKKIPKPSMKRYQAMLREKLFG